MVGILHQLALGDFQLDKLRPHARFVDDRADARREVQLPELPRREVHRHGERLGAVGFPCAQVGARLPQHPFADRNDEPAFLQDRNEVRRRDDAAARMVPAQERLGAARALALQVELRLIDEAEFAALERAAKLGPEERAGARALVDLGGKELEAVSARLLGAVHGGVGGAEERLDILAVGGEKRDADAGADEELVAADRYGRAQPLDQLLRHHRRILGTRQVGEHDGELVAGDARYGIAGAHPGLQTARRLLQELIAARMPERIVHQLELVQVDEQHAELGAAPARLHNHLREAVGKKGAVGQPGERIELRKKGEPAFALDALQTGREHARGGGEEAGFIMAEPARARRHGTERTARAIFALNGRELRPLVGRPGEGQLATAAASLLERLGERTAARVYGRRAGLLGRCSFDATYQQLAPLRPALEVGDGATAEAFQHRAHSLGDQLVGVALGERFLAKAGDLFLVALVRRPPLLALLAARDVLDH